MLKNDRLLKAIWRESVDATPIWIMRQAGRYLPEYRALRAKAGSFMRLCKTPELACEVTLQPINRYPLDAAIIFSDILTIPDAMGLDLQVIEGKGPIFAKPVRTARDINQLRVPDPASLAYVYEAIQLVNRELDSKVPLVGFCGSPWTLAAYMVEGQSQLGFPQIKAMQAAAPQLLHKLLTVLADAVSAHLNAQMAAGAQVAMIFDTWGGMLKSSEDYEAWSLHYIRQAIAGLKRTYNNQYKLPVILFTKEGHRFLEQMADVGCDSLGVDWTISLREARQRVGKKVALQGNMNPKCLLGSEATIREEVKCILAAYGQGSGHVFNLGHGITPDIPPDKVALLIDTVHALSQSYHRE